MRMTASQDTHAGVDKPTTLMRECTRWPPRGFGDPSNDQDDGSKAQEKDLVRMAENNDI